MDQFGEDAVLDVGELPAAERNTGVHGVALLGGHRGPVGGDGGDDHLVADLEILDHGSHLDDLTDRLVAEHHVVAFPHATLVDGVDVGGARGQGDRAADRVHRPALRILLLNPPGLTDPEHRVTLHFASLHWVRSIWCLPSKTRGHLTGPTALPPNRLRHFSSGHLRFNHYSVVL